ncbi:cupin domain-containing protein [Alphaproteobacteria bacterium]|nr:cupin domain-containing protein [Alphaproteobacteria bacterium]
MKNLEEKFGNKFFLEHFGVNYLYKPKFFDEFEEMMSLDILDSMLSKTNIWNNKNFIMMLDQKKLNYGDYSSISMETTGNNYRPDVNKVENLVARGASIILNEIEKHNKNLLKIADDLQNLTNGRCQGNLYFSMASHQAFGPHFDLHDVFAIHFEGEKVWNIYENIEKTPINHPAFKLSSDERRKRAGNIIDQVTLRPGDLLYIPRGQYHDALASKNGAIHIAFGLSYFKPIDMMTTLWEKFIINDFMREDIGIRPSENEVKKLLQRLSNELSNVINSEEAVNDVTKNIKQWPYQIKNFSLKSLLSEGPVYFVDKSVKFEKSKNKSFLKSPKATVEIPQKFETIIEFLLRHETINKNKIKNEFKNISNDIIDECIENLKKMSVIKLS